MWVGSRVNRTLAVLVRGACYNNGVRCCSSLVAGLVASLAAASPARAERATASVTAAGDVSATDNVFATPRDVRESDVSFLFRPGILLGYDAPRASHQLGLEGEILEFARHSENPSLSLRAAARTRLITTKATTFGAELGASNGVLTALSQRNSPAVNNPLVTPVGRVDTQTANAGVDFSWDNGNGFQLTENLFARGDRTDDNADDAPGIDAPTIITSVEGGGAITANRQFGRNNAVSLGVGASVLRLQRDAPATAMLGPRLDRQINPRASMQWRHDYNARWSSALDVGAVYVIPFGEDPDNPGLDKTNGLFPVFGGAVGYTEVWGRAQLQVRRDVAPNQLLAQNTLNDLAALQLTVPLSWLDKSGRRDPPLVALGSLGVTRTQLIDTTIGDTTSKFYAALVDIGLGYSPRPGFTYGLRYELNYQSGDKAAEMAIPGFWRQTVSLTFRITYPNRVNGEAASRRVSGSVRADGADLVPIGVEPTPVDPPPTDDGDRGGGTGDGMGNTNDDDNDDDDN